MKFDIGNVQAAVWQTEEAIASKRLELERADDERLGKMFGRSLAGLEDLLAIQQRTLEFLVRQDRRPPPTPHALCASA